jgi:hypothetical protein
VSACTFPYFFNKCVADSLRSESLRHILQTVFRIRNILVRIWIRGSVPWTCGFSSESRSCFGYPAIFEFFCLLLFEGTFTSFSKDKKSQNSRNQGFSYYFCLMIEGSGFGPLSNGSGSGRPKHLRIRIRNIAYMIYLIKVENLGTYVLIQH